MRTALHRSWIFTLAVLFPLLSPAQQREPGVIVEEIAIDSAAAKAGLKLGDRIVSYDSRQLSSPAAFEAAQANTFGKQEAAMEVRRGQETLRMHVPLGTLGIQVRPNLPTDVQSLYDRGRTSIKAKALDDAIAKWEAAAKLAQQEGDLISAAWLYGRAGSSWEDREQWKNGVETYLKAWELLKQSSPNDAAVSKTARALGRCNGHLGDFSASENWLERARQLDLSAGNELWFATDLNGLGIDAYKHGDLPAAHEYHTQALSIRERLAPESLVVADSLNNLGTVALDRGDLQAAQDSFTHALSICERLVAGSLAVAGSLDNLGLVAQARGDLAAATQYHTRALSIRERLMPDSSEVASSLNNLGNVALSGGDLKAAQSFYRRALSIHEQIAPDSLDVAGTLGNLGNVARELGDLRAAQEYVERALAIQERLTPDSLDVAADLASLGSISTLRGDLREAQDFYNRALSIYERIAPTSLDSGEILTGLGNIALKDKRLLDADRFFNRAISIVEAQRATIASAEDRALLVAQNNGPYTGLLRTYLTNNNLPAAFLTSERARARSLLELLTEAHADIRQGVELSLLERERSLQKTLNAKALLQMQLLSGKHTDEEATTAAKEIDSLTLEYQELEAQIRATSPHYADLTQRSE